MTMCDESELDEAKKQITKLEGQIKGLEERKRYLESELDNWQKEWSELRKRMTKASRLVRQLDCRNLSPKQVEIIEIIE
jgi:predicted nuclease with TOPRIM domain